MALLGGILFSTQISMVVKRINDQGTVDARVVVTDAMLQMIQEKPIFGWGYENFESTYQRLLQVSGWRLRYIRFDHFT